MWLGPSRPPPPCPLLAGAGRDRVQSGAGGSGQSMWPLAATGPHLVRGNEAQELVHVAHVQPVGVELHRGLHLLGREEVLQGLVHLLALGAAHTGGEERKWSGGGAGEGPAGRSLRDWGLGQGVRKGIQEPGLLVLHPLTLEEVRHFHPSLTGETEAGSQ